MDREKLQTTLARLEGWLKATKEGDFLLTREDVIDIIAELHRSMAAFQSRHLPARVLDMCRAHKWDMKWNARGCYLFLEGAELVESLRGKGDDTPEKEAGDVLIVLMSITEHAGIPWHDVVRTACETTEKMIEDA